MVAYLVPQIISGVRGDSHVNSSGMFGEKVSPWRFQKETPLVLAVKVSFRVVFEEMLSSSF